jgi:hypothetical protein
MSLNYLRTLIISLLLCGLCYANTFLIQEKQPRRTRQALKQDISHQIGLLIEQSSLLLEKEVQIQQLLFKEVRAALEGSQGSRFNKATPQELERLLIQLRTEYQKRSEHLVAQQAFLGSIR